MRTVGCMILFALVFCQWSDERRIAPVHFPFPFPVSLLTLLFSSFFPSPHHSCLSSLSSPFLSLLVQGDESGCVRVWKSTPQGFTQPAAWKIHDAHKGVCRCLCVCVYACVFGEGMGWWGGNGKREQGETEKKGNRRGDKGTECETNWWSTAGLSLKPTIILTAALHIFSDANHWHICILGLHISSNSEETYLPTRIAW